MNAKSLPFPDRNESSSTSLASNSPAGMNSNALAEGMEEAAETEKTLEGGYDSTLNALREPDDNGSRRQSDVLTPELSVKARRSHADARENLIYDFDKEESDGSEESELLSDSPRNLYVRIIRRPSEIDACALEWLARVQTDGPGAVSQALSLVADVARGCSASDLSLVSPAMIIANRPQDAVQEICHALAVDPVDKKKLNKRVRKHLHSFWCAIVRSSSEAILFDTDCFDTLLSWLDAMSRAASRVLRISACVAAYALVDGFLDAGARLRSQLTTYQRQLSTEQKKRSSPVSTRTPGRQATPVSSAKLTAASDTLLTETRIASEGVTGMRHTRSSSEINDIVHEKHVSKQKGPDLSVRAKELTRKVEELSSKNTELNELTDKVFMSIFVLKYRDVSPEIRAVSVEALGSWILRYPEHFLDDTHNKYIGWLLFDKDAAVRRASLGALTALFSEQTFAPSLDMFLRRFISRIVEMSNDKDIDVCVAAVRLCTAIASSIVLDQDDNIEILASHVASEHPELRREAGAFLAALISTKEFDNDVEKNSDSRDSRAILSRNRALHAKRNAKKANIEDRMTCMKDIGTAKEDIRELIFIAMSEPAANPNISAYILDAMWSHFPAIRHWKAYCELLLEHTKRGRKTPSGSDELGDDDMVTIAAIFLEAAKRATAESHSVRSRQKRNMELDRTELIAEYMTDVAPSLPKLLTNFRTEPRVFVILAQIPTTFNPAVYARSALRPYYKPLLSVLSDSTNRLANDAGIVRAVVGTLRHLADGSSAPSSEAKVCLRKEADRTAKALHLRVHRRLREGDLYSFASCLARASVMSEIFDLQSSALDDAQALLTARVEKMPIPGYEGESFSTHPCFRSAGLDLCRLIAGLEMWTTANVLANCQDTCTRDAIDIDAVRDLYARRNSFLIGLIAIAQDKEEHLSVRVAAMKSCSVLMTLSNGMQAKLLGMHRELSDIGDKIQIEEEARVGNSIDSSNFFMSTIKDVCNVVDYQKLVEICIVCATEAICHHLQGHACVNTDKRSVGNPDLIARDLLSSIGQMSLQNAIPRQGHHIPLLGFLLEKETLAPCDDGPSEPEVAKFCYIRYRQSLSQGSVREIELAALRHCILIDRKLGSEESLPSVQALASCFLNQNGATDLNDSAFQMLQCIFSQCISSSVSFIPTNTSGIEDSDVHLIEQFLIAVAKPLLPYLSQDCASSLLKQLTSLLSSESTEEYRKHGSDGSLHSGKPKLDLATLHQHLREIEAGLSSFKGKRTFAGKKRIRAPLSARKSTLRKKSRDARSTNCDMPNVRRSGRTQRIVYTEMDSNTDDSEMESLSDGGDIDNNGDSGLTSPSDRNLDGNEEKCAKYRDTHSSVEHHVDSGKSRPSSSLQNVETNQIENEPSSNENSSHVPHPRSTNPSPQGIAQTSRTSDKENICNEPTSKVPKVQRSRRSRRW